MSKRQQLHQNLQEKNLVISRQEINFKVGTDKFIYRSAYNGDEVFHILIDKKGAHFKMYQSINLNVETLKIITELMELLVIEEKQNYGIGE